MENYSYGFLKCKRPPVGYATEKERNFNRISGISDWEVFYKNKKIGIVFYVGTVATQWRYSCTDETIKITGNESDKKWAIQTLFSEWRIKQKELINA